MKVRMRVIQNQFIDVLEVFNNTNEYIFTDYGISAGSINNWSFPNYPSHIDHILINSVLNLICLGNFS